MLIIICRFRQVAARHRDVAHTGQGVQIARLRGQRGLEALFGGVEVALVEINVA